MKKYKIVYHFNAEVPEHLRGFYRSIEALNPINALKEAVEYEQLITTWNDEWVCVNHRNVMFFECVEIEEGGGEE